MNRYIGFAKVAAQVVFTVPLAEQAAKRLRQQALCLKKG
jgi:hypothetical protein